MDKVVQKHLVIQSEIVIETIVLDSSSKNSQIPHLPYPPLCMKWPVKWTEVQWITLMSDNGSLAPNELVLGYHLEIDFCAL